MHEGIAWGAWACDRYLAGGNIVVGGGALAVTAANTLVAAAVTDAWEAARRGFLRLFGRDDPAKAELADRRLAAAHDELAAAADGGGDAGTAGCPVGGPYLRPAG